MAGSERNGHSRRKAGRDPDLARGDKGEEEQVEQVEETERDRDRDKKRDARQDAVGNEGVAAMLGVNAVSPGEAGLSVEPAHRQDEEQGLSFGGDDDAPADGPLTLDDLVRSWNPGTRRGQDTAAFREQVPAEDLPPEEAGLRAVLARDPGLVELPPASTPDALLQPSLEAVTGDLGGWAREAARWSSGSLVHRTWARLLSPPAPMLQDPWGRVAPSRIRIGALGALLVVDALGAGDSPQAPALVNLCLELAGRHRLMDEVWADVQQGENRLPVARAVLAPYLADHPAGRVRPATPTGAAAAHLQQVLEDLLDAGTANVLLPALPAEAAGAEEDEDPLGIDAIVAQHTGGAPDPSTGIYEAALLAAEKLAGACARIRVRAAGLGRVVAETCALWSSGAPTEDLLALMDQVDAEVQQTLALLVEIARAIQRRAVAPSGIRNGLRRVARGVDKAAALVVSGLLPIVGGVLPGPSVDLPPPVARPDADPLDEAWADGSPRLALGWLGGLPPSLDRDVAVAFTRAAAGERPATLAPALLALARRAGEADRPLLALALQVVAGPGLSWAGETDAALALAATLDRAGRARRNGMLVAAGAALAIEAHRATGDPEAAERARVDAARVCWHLGSPAGLTLLLRWTPPEAPDAEPRAAVS